MIFNDHLSNLKWFNRLCNSGCNFSGYIMATALDFKYIYTKSMLQLLKRENVHYTTWFIYDLHETKNSISETTPGELHMISVYILRFSI